ncbi:MAG: ECF-type riboflavin transporter substrate-binding protein [Clostridium sp.]|uniref:ECF-type riboflavin transporter substrate-binding protein n=1 Tax=Clostridium sp. TaxID=1506 RepID=UPI0025C1D5BF|nr:ECF-type riboflavin transporter substrate-binding protein [Clostridium sp.]MCF0147716.1 ECF-type riboflavin transporter substrate-binding protein [Clostridium sp.]
MKKDLSIKTIVAIGIGAAVFMILGRFGSIPSGIPNTNIETSYAFLALMAVLYGPIAGLSIGFIGHALKDLVFYGSPWFSWVIASAGVGLILGLGWNKLKVNDGEFQKKEIIIFNIYQVAANILAWIIIAPTLDVIIYAEPINKVYLQGIIAAISNSITVGILGTFLINTYSKTRVKKGSLDRE